jgi:fucose 4-O-acetylase-like acetyltransferase
MDPESSAPTILTTIQFLFCFVFFPNFIAIFHLAQPHFPYLEMYTGP